MISPHNHLRYSHACLFLLALSLPLSATVVQVSSVNIGANDQILWSSLGGDLTPLSPPVDLLSQAGRQATLSGSTAFTVFSGSTYNADFLPADTVVSAFDLNTFTSLTTGIRVAFLVPAVAVGAQIQVNAFGPFQGTLEAFDSNSVSLGSVFVNSAVSGNGDGSAPFLGLRSSTLISSVLFTSNSTGVAIDSLEILSTPEPAGLALVLPALAALAILRKRR
jgi:hypothetical protein